MRRWRRKARILTRAKGLSGTPQDGNSGRLCRAVGASTSATDAPRWVPPPLVKMTELALQQLLPVHHRTHRTAIGQFRRTIAIRFEPRFCQFRLGGQRHHIAHGAAFLGGAGSTAEEHLHRPPSTAITARRSAAPACGIQGHARSGRIADSQHPPSTRPSGSSTAGGSRPEEYGPVWPLSPPGNQDSRAGTRARRCLHRRTDHGRHGVYIPPMSCWPEIERICRKYDVLLADE